MKKENKDKTKNRIKTKSIPKPILDDKDLIKVAINPELRDSILVLGEKCESFNDTFYRILDMVEFPHFGNRSERDYLISMLGRKGESPNDAVIRILDMLHEYEYFIHHE